MTIVDDCMAVYNEEMSVAEAKAKYEECYTLFEQKKESVRRKYFVAKKLSTENMEFAVKVLEVVQDQFAIMIERLNAVSEMGLDAMLYYAFVLRKEIKDVFKEFEEKEEVSCE